jgi:hypothetical protein
MKEYRKGETTSEGINLQVGEMRLKKASAEKNCDGAEAGSAVVPGLVAIL